MSHRVGSQHQYRQRWIPGDIRAAVVATPKDVVARVAAPDMDPLGEYFIGRIQAVGGVTRTVCDLLDRAPLESLASNGWLSRTAFDGPVTECPGLTHLSTQEQRSLQTYDLSCSSRRVEWWPTRRALYRRGLQSPC